MKNWLRIRTHSTRWQIDPEWADLASIDDGLGSSAWATHGSVETLKSNRHRALYRLHGPKGTIYIKNYPIHGFRAWCRRWLRPPKAVGEFRKMVALRSRGVPTSDPIAVGRQPNGGSILISRELENTSTLTEFVESVLPQKSGEVATQLRTSLAHELARLLARAHERGIYHRDLHSGNILVRWPGSDSSAIDLFLIDLHTARIKRRLGPRASLRNLTVINRWFLHRASRSDRLRFWAAYLKFRGWKVTHSWIRHTARGLELRTRDSCAKFWQRRTKRCTSRNRRFRRVKESGYKGWAVSDLCSATLSSILADPNQVLHGSNARLIKDSRTSTVATLEFTIDGQQRQYILKRFNPKKKLGFILDWFRPHPAMRSWINGHALIERMLPTARPLAIFRRKGRFSNCPYYLLTERIPDVIELKEYLNQLDAHHDRTKIDQIVDQLANLLRVFHARGLAHRDLKSANLMIQPHRSRLLLIDLVGVERRRDIPESLRIRNLVRLNSSFLNCPAINRAAKLRFMHTYLRGSCRNPARAARHWWKLIGAGTLKKISRNERIGRPLE